MLGGIIDYLGDPTGMDAYRSGLRQQEAAQRGELEDLRGRMDTLGAEYDATGQQIAGQYAPIAALGVTGAERLQGDYTTATPQYQFQGQVEDYLDPSIAYQQQQARQQLEQSAAARGSLMSGAAMKAIADRAQQIGQQGYADAYARMERDRAYGTGQAQQDYLNRNQQAQQQLQQAQQIATLGLQGLAGQTSGQTYGTSGSVGVRQGAYGETVNPTAGLGDVRAGQMRGDFTKGVFDLGGEYLKGKF